eukprot:Hpha_TRINITY_DN15934_c1_g1::TRINITY_DN15934_c1_g1_i1::g.73565::m.73565/K10408/DNAH; dynein heavy chain, axonemal
MAVVKASHVLEGLQERFNQLVFEVDRNEGVLSVRSFDRTFGFIDDTLVIINDLCAEKDTSLEERDALIALRVELSLLNDVLEIFGPCQSQVQYLYPLFRHGAERDGLEKWNEFMDELGRLGDSARALAKKGWLERLRELNHDYKTTALSLGELVAEQQARFGRLCFLSNEEVLTLLAADAAPEGEVINRVQPFVRRLFGFTSLVCDGEDGRGGEVVSVLSDFGEEVELVGPAEGPGELQKTPVAVQGRSVVEWLAELAEVSRRSMVLLTLRSVELRADYNLRDWATMGPGQATVAASRIVFTRRIESALRRMAARRRKLSMTSDDTGGQHGTDDREMREHFKDIEADIREVAGWVVMGSRRARVRALLALLLSQRAVLERLLDAGVETRTDLRWETEERWYLDHISPTDMSASEISDRDLQFIASAGSWPRIRVVVAHCENDYYGEYPPYPPVLCDDGLQHFNTCVLQTLQAKAVGCTVYQEQLEPSSFAVITPQPPHVLIADLAASLGKKWEIVQCTSDTPITTVAKCLRGAFACGTWLCFKDADRLDPTVISLINEGCLNIRDALRAGAKQYQFEGRVLQIVSHTAAVFCTLSGQELCPVRRLSVKRMKELLRPVACPQHSVQSVVAWHLQLHGFERFTAEIMSRGMGVFFERCAKHAELSRQCPVGVRFVREFFAALAQVLEVMEFAGTRPQEVLANAIYKSVLRQTPPEVWPDVHTLVCSCLGPDTVPSPSQQQPLLDSLSDSIIRHLEEARLEPNPLFVVKCEQVYEALRISPAVIIVGPPQAGKTAAWRCIQRSSVPSASSGCVFPNAIAGLFGCTDASHEWADGPYTHLFRQFAARQSDGQQWIVLDGAISQEVADTLVPVVDPTCRTLTLETGEMIRAGGNFRMIFECSSLTEIPAELRELCAVVQFDGTVLTTGDYIRHYANQPRFFLGNFSHYVIETMDRLVPPVVEWALSVVRPDWDTDKDPRRDGEPFFPFLPAALIRGCYDVINGFRDKRQVSRLADDRSEGPTAASVESLVLFGVVWSFGAALCPTHKAREEFSIFIRRLVVDADINARFPPPVGDELGLVFDYLYDVDLREWQVWETVRRQQQTLTPEPPVWQSGTWVTTTDTFRMEWILQHLADKSVRLLLAGEDGVGKRTMAHRSVRNPTTVHCAGTTVADAEAVVGARLQKSREGVICLPDKVDKPLCLTLCSVEKANTPVLDFTKQLADCGGWYDGYTNRLLEVHDVTVTATVSVEGLRRFSARQIAQFHCMSVLEPEAPELAARLFVEDPEAPAPKNEREKRYGEALVKAHAAVRSELGVPGSLYANWPISTLFSILEFCRRIPHERAPHVADRLRLLGHEACVIFGARIPDGDGRRRLESIVWESIRCVFPEVSTDAITRGRPYILYAGIEEYRDFKDPANWIETMGKLAEKCVEGRKGSHGLGAPRDGPGLPPGEANVTEMVRALREPGGHLLMLSDCPAAHIEELRLVSFFIDANLFRADYSVHYTRAEWRDFLKGVCMHSVVSAKPDVILVEEHVLDELAAADIGALVKGGELIDLFSPADWSSMTVLIGNFMRRRGEMLRGKEHVRQIAASRILQNLRFVVACSPSSPVLRRNVTTVAALRTHLVPLHPRDAHETLLGARFCSSLGGDMQALRAAVEMYQAVRSHVQGSPFEGAVDVSPNSFEIFLSVAEEAGKASGQSKEERRETCSRALAAVGAYADKADPEGQVLAREVGSRWERMLGREDGVGEEGEANHLVLAASVTWLSALPASERAVLSDRFALVLTRCGLQVSTTFDPVDHYLSYRPGLPAEAAQVWRRGGLLGSSLQIAAVAMEVLPPSRPLLLIDPHTLGISLVRSRLAAGHISGLRILRPPFTVGSLPCVCSALATGGTLVLDGVCAADLDQPWLVAVVASLAKSREANSGRAGTVQLGDREYIVPAGFRLVLILDSELHASRFPTVVRVSCSVLNMRYEEQQLAEMLCAEALEEAFPTPEPRRNEVARNLAVSERKLAEVPSGSALPVARWEQEIPALLQGVADGDRDYTELSAELRAVAAKAAPSKVPLLELGRAVAQAVLAAAEFERLERCSSFSLEFFVSALREAVRQEGANLSASDWQQRAPELAQKLLVYFFERIGSSAPYPSSYTFLAWLLILARRDGPPEATLQRMVTAQPSRPPDLCNPDPSWLSPEAASGLHAVLSVPEAGLEGAWGDLGSNVETYRKHYVSQRCDPSHGAPSWHFPAEGLVNLVLTRLLRPDLLLNVLHNLVASDSGLGVTVPTQAPSAREVLQDSIEALDASTPLLVLTPDDDPDDFFVRNVQSIARGKLVQHADGRTEPMIRRTFFIGAAPSQRSMAVSLIDDAFRDGGWIVCTNVALSDEFAVELDEVVAGWERGDKVPDPNFRLILQTPSTDLLPVSLIRKSAKVGLSRRWGLASQLKSFASNVEEYFKTPGSATGLGDPPRLEQFAAFLPCLVIFHTLVTERAAAIRKSAGGDTKWFGRETLVAAVRETVRILLQYPPGQTPVEAVRLQVAEVVYGARLVDPAARRLLGILATSCINEACKGEAYRFGPGDAHFVGGVRHHFLKYVESLEDTPTEPDLVLLGAGVLASEARARAAHFCQRIESLHYPSAPPTRALSQSLVDSLHKTIPSKGLSPEAAFEWLPDPDTPVLLVLYPLMQQELRRYTLLLSTLQRDLGRLDVWLRGEMPLPPDLEPALQRLHRGGVPRAWLEFSGCTKPTDVAHPESAGPALAAWLEWLVGGHDFFEKWSGEGVQPNVLNISAFIDPFAVLRAVVDQCADAEGASASDVELEILVLPDGAADHAKRSPQRNLVDGTQAFYISGLWLRHAEWDNDAQTLRHPESVRAFELLPLAEIRARRRDTGGPEMLTRTVVYRDFAHRSAVGELMLPPTIEGPLHWDSQGVALSTLPW